MRKETICGRTFNVRPLTRGEVKSLRKEHGCNLMALAPDKAEEAMDRVFEMEFNEEEIAFIDKKENPEALKLWKAVLAETYGSQGEEKNSSASGDGSQTEPGRDTAGNA